VRSWSCFFSFVFYLLISFGPIAAQEIDLETALFGYVDNREFKSAGTEDKTFFALIFSPKVSLSMDERHHGFHGGLHYSRDFGTRKGRHNPLLYYNYREGGFDFAIGFMPRHERIFGVPRIVMADTFLYDRPNIEGMHLAFRKNDLWQSLHIDWLGKQGTDVRERFLVGLSGKYPIGAFYLAEDALLYHNALASVRNPDDRVQDNAVAVLRFGWDGGRKTGLDSLTTDVGYAVGFDRLRTVYDLTAQGFLANLYAGHKRFFLTGTLYLGEAQHLPLGDPFYRRKAYNRTDIGWISIKKIFKKRGHIDGRLTVSFHFAPDGISNQQTFLLRMAM